MRSREAGFTDIQVKCGSGILLCPSYEKGSILSWGKHLLFSLFLILQAGDFPSLILKNEVVVVCARGSVKLSYPPTLKPFGDLLSLPWWRFLLPP